MSRGRPRLDEAERLERERRGRLLRGWRRRWVCDVEFERALDVYLAGRPDVGRCARMEVEAEELEDEVAEGDDLEVNALAAELCPQDFKFNC